MGRIFKRGKAKRRAAADRKDRIMMEKERLKEERQLRAVRKRHGKKLSRRKLEDVPLTVDELSQYTPAMQSQIEEQGMAIPEDATPEEVAAIYNSGILGDTETIPQDAMNEAYIYDDSGYSSYEEYLEHAEKRRGWIRTAAGAVTGAIGGALGAAKDKKRTGEPLTKTDEAILRMEREAKQKYISQNKGTFMNIGMFAAIIVILLLVFKR